MTSKMMSNDLLGEQKDPLNSLTQMFLTVGGIFFVSNYIKSQERWLMKHRTDPDDTPIFMHLAPKIGKKILLDVTRARGTSTSSFALHRNHEFYL